jgi:hypothetical protein
MRSASRDRIAFTPNNSSGRPRGAGVEDGSASFAVSPIFTPTNRQAATVIRLRAAWARTTLGRAPCEAQRATYRD